MVPRLATRNDAQLATLVRDGLPDRGMPGASTISEIKECNKHLQSTTVVRIALNKSSEMGPAYYGKY
jgi:hypothetical protein